jgi:hypothetical protein
MAQKKDKYKLATRIVAGILAGLMVLGATITLIYIVIENFKG